MEGSTGLQTMSGYVPLTAKNRHFSVALATTEVKQKKDVPGFKDNRELFSEQLNLLETIQKAENVSFASCVNVIQARVPNLSELKNLVKGIKLTEIRKKMKILLGNLVASGEITGVDDIDKEVNALIEKGANINEEKYKKLFGEAKDVEYKQKVYDNPRNADTSLNKVDSDNLKVVLSNAQQTVSNTLYSSSLIKNVFGEKTAIAEDCYKMIFSKLFEVHKGIDKKVTSDYNGDDVQQSLEGSASFPRQTMHIAQSLCEDSDESKTTVIHECAHLVDENIIDLGYINTPGFKEMSADDKINNASHYEVVPAWILGIDIDYKPDEDFIPKDEEKKEQTPIEEGKKLANDYLEAAWSCAGDFVSDLRNMYVKRDTIDENIFSIMNLSCLKRGIKPVTVLDIALAEDITRTIAELKIPKDATEMLSTPEEYKDYFIEQALIQNERNGVDRDMLDKLVEYKKKHDNL